MKKEIADKWVAALRSGEYQQGRGQLKTEDGKFCCLGVLCEITLGFDKIATDSMNVYPTHIPGYDALKTSGGTLKNKYRIPDPENEYSFGVYEDLWLLNDNGMTFSEIADIIEKEWENL